MEGLKALESAWVDSDALFALLAEPAFRARPIPLRQPFLFYLGHLPAFAWRHLGAACGKPPADRQLDALFERGIDPRDTDAGAADRAAWPPVSRVREYVAEVRDRLRLVAARHEECPPGCRLPMVVEHERMHHETLLYMLQALDGRLKRPPSAPRPFSFGRALPPGLVHVPAGTAVLGTRERGFRWDNERPETGRFVPAFQVDKTAVRNVEFLEFVEAGGYRNAGLWSDEARCWLQATRRTRPHFWTPEPEPLGVRGMFETLPWESVADWPVYVTWAEAAAYSAWRGARLPSEAEFHRAAYGTPDGEPRPHPWGDAPPSPEFGNFGLHSWSPTPVGSHVQGASAWGVVGLVGNGWEWTATPFAGYPGFSAQPEYPGYSADFFDGRHYVLLGASWATHARFVRRSFRNFFQPHYPWVFAKFRCVRPA
jgi:ergothioneine biosynthesis protein EgtB